VRPITVTVGPNATAGTPSGLIMFDPWALPQVNYQATVNGTVNFTVQISNDDPNSPTNPVPLASMNWAPDPNATMVGASTNQEATWPIAPLMARVLVNSGAGSVSVTFVQFGAVPQ